MGKSKCILKLKDTILFANSTLVLCPGIVGPCLSSSKIASTCIDSANSKSSFCRLCNDDQYNKNYQDSQVAHFKYDQTKEKFNDVNEKYIQVLGDTPVHYDIKNSILFTLEVHDSMGRKMTHVNIIQADIETLNPLNRSVDAYLGDNHIDFANILMWNNLSNEYRDDLFFYPTLDFYHYIYNDKLRDCKNPKESLWVKVFSTRKVLFFPCCINKHFSLIAVVPDPGCVRMYHFDSLSPYHSSTDFFEKFESYVIKMFSYLEIDIPPIEQEIIPVTRQKNGIDCGLHCIHNISIVVQNYISEKEVNIYNLCTAYSPLSSSPSSIFICRMTKVLQITLLMIFLSRALTTYWNQQ